MVCCPQCGYQMVDERKSTAAGWLRRLLRRDPGPARVSARGVKSLADLASGQSGEVVTIATQQASRLDRLSALGIVPGSRITLLLQRTPAFILRVGETELTLDESIAREILTRA